MRFAYVDPPYIGQARRYYRDRLEYSGEVDHAALIIRLHNEFPDGWVLSASAASLWDLLPMIPKTWKCRIGAWCKPLSQLGAHGRPRWAWEPVIFCGGRPYSSTMQPPYDWILANPVCTAEQKYKAAAHRKWFRGAKPDEFCYWIFELLNMHTGDELIDLFPGTGRVMRAWERYQAAGVKIFTGG